MQPDSHPPFDDLAPNTQHIDTQDEDRERLTEEQLTASGIDPTPPQFDLAADLNLPTIQSERFQNANELDDNDYRKQMRQLNVQQKRFHDMVMHHITTSQTPLHLFLSGGAGVGKTMTTKVLYQSILKYENSKPGKDPTTLKILLLAPTGKAAFLIRGNTIHSALRIPIQQFSVYKALDCNTLNTLQVQLNDCNYVFIDEISMVGNKLFSFLYQRLKDIKGNDLPFGGMSIITIGDLFQLKPVCDSFLAQNPSHGLLPLATNLWTEYFSMYELTTIMHQKDDQPFAMLLNQLREGQQTDQHINLLLQRSTTRDPLTLPSPYLCLRNTLVDSYNDAKFHLTSSPKITIQASDKLAKPLNPSMTEQILSRISFSTQKTQQLAYSLKIALGTTIELSLNLCTEDGLTNGASGVVTCLPNSGDILDSSAILWVQFAAENIGQSFRQQNSHLYQQPHISSSWTPIFPVVRSFNYTRTIDIHRKQFPVRAVAAKTMWRAQGDTYSEMTADFTGRSNPHIHYVAISRATTISSLHLINFDPTKISLDATVVQEMQRLRQQPFPLTLNELSNQQSKKIAFLNVQSLPLHYDDIATDYNMTAADIIILAETRLHPNSPAPLLPHFPHIIRNDDTTSSATRPFHGLALYSRQQPQHPQISMTSDNVEFLMSTHDHNGQFLRILGVYKPPRTPLQTFLDHLASFIIDHQLPHHRTIILGDFNIDIATTSSPSRQLLQLMANHGFTQCQTHTTTRNRTQIDHIYVNFANNMNTGVTDVYYSYHKSVWITI